MLDRGERMHVNAIFGPPITRRTLRCPAVPPKRHSVLPSLGHGSPSISASSCRAGSDLRGHPRQEEAARMLASATAGLQPYVPFGERQADGAVQEGPAEEATDHGAVSLVVDGWWYCGGP